MQNNLCKISTNISGLVWACQWPQHPDPAVQLSSVPIPQRKCTDLHCCNSIQDIEDDVP